MSEGRWTARLAALSHDDLLAIAAKGCVNSRITAQFADAVIQPLPEWAVSSVLQSPDLIMHIFAELDPEELTSAGCTCSLWRGARDRTLSSRRTLGPVATEVLLTT